MAGRPPGHPKSGGRKKNTPNKTTTVIQDFRTRLETKKIDIEAELAKAILQGNVDMIKALTGLMPYLTPRLKEAEEKPPIPQEEPTPTLQAVSTDNLVAFISKAKHDPK